MSRKRRNNRLEELFPHLSRVGYTVRSCQTPRYNCIAYAAGDYGKRWEPGYYWPLGAEHGNDLHCLATAFQSIGYMECANGDLEDGFEKIVLYQYIDETSAHDIGEWSHAARQLPNGKWGSKIGDLEDTIHKTPQALEGIEYGRVGLYMKRRLRRGRLR